jgi:PAS domain S-box-containing protein
MRLSGKVVLIVVTTVSLFITLIFTVLLIRTDNQIEQNILNTSRSIYRNVLITRKWVSDQDGVFVKKTPAMAPNPYLPHPYIFTDYGDTLLMKNPALVTRELSEMSRYMGNDFSYHMASLNYINPENRPDDFEQSALLSFAEKGCATCEQEFYRIETIAGKPYFRYFAPLYIEASCLKCHEEHGYKQVGELRGGISVMLAIDDYVQAKHHNFIFFVSSAVASICLLSVFLFIGFQRNVIKPLKLIEDSARQIEDGNYDFKLEIPRKDEIGSLANTFDTMRQTIQRTTMKLRSSEQKYRTLIENSLEAIAIITEDGRILESNQKLANMTGQAVEELIGQNIYRFVDLTRKKALGTARVTSQDAEHFETFLVTPDHLEIPVEIYIIKGLSLSSDTTMSFVYVRDLSERKKIEQYSIQAEKMFSLGQLSSGIAHEIRNPLFALSNNLEYLKQEYSDSEKFKEIYAEVRDGIDRIHRIVAAVLDYAKPHKPDFRPVSITEVIEKCLMLVKKRCEHASITITTDFCDTGEPIEADAHQLEQIFLNIIMNSIQALDGRGIVTITTQSVDGHLEITIQDTGKGIPPEEIPRIFDPFYSKSPNGTGLGLAIVQRILDQHQAICRVESQVGVGATFTIQLPYRQE